MVERQKIEHGKTQKKGKIKSKKRLFERLFEVIIQDLYVVESRRHQSKDSCGRPGRPG